MKYLILSFLSKRSILALISASAGGSSEGAISTTVTFLPNPEKILAHSIPIAPEPIISILSGMLFSCKSSSEFTIKRPSVSKPFICAGFAPVAMIMFSHWYSFSPALIIFSEIRAASSSIIVTSWLKINFLRLFWIFCVRVFFLSNIFSQLNAAFSMVMPNFSAFLRFL